MDLEDGIAFLILSGLALGLLWGAWVVFVSEFPNAAIWQRRRDQFLEQAKLLGFEVDPDACTARKKVGEYRVTAGIKTVRSSKSTSIVLYARVPLPDCPSGLTISQESLGGVARAFGATEENLGDPDFDAVFWVNCDDELAMRQYLTAERRQTLMQWLPEIPTSRIVGGEVAVDVSFATPTKLGAYSSPLLRDLEQLARACQGEPVQVPQRPGGSVVEAKLRKFAKGGLLLWSLLLVVGVLQSPAHLGSQLVTAWSTVMVLLNAGLYGGRTGSRVLLQGVYAFLSLACGAGLLLGLLEAAELLPGRYFRLKEDEIAGFAIAGSLLTLCCWSCRHYLKALGRFGPQGAGTL